MDKAGRTAIGGMRRWAGGARRLADAARGGGRAAARSEVSEVQRRPGGVGLGLWVSTRYRGLSVVSRGVCCFPPTSLPQSADQGPAGLFPPPTLQVWAES